MKIKKRIPRKKEGTNQAEDLQEILKDIETKSAGIFEKYKVPVIIAVVASVIILVGAISYKLLTSHWDRNASVMEYSAYNYFLEGNYTKSISSFQEIADKYSGSKSAPVAYYYIGNSYSALGQYDDAIRVYNSFIDKFSEQETILPLVYINLGSAYLEKSDYNNALSAFRKVLSLKDTLAADRAVYEMARAYEASGDAASAIEQYDNLIKT
ncbi:MAG: hypothetical protein A2Z47_12465, partial [Thermodesulfovibrio sp. RBG_19FT_COMBO_42_12]